MAGAALAVADTDTDAVNTYTRRGLAKFQRAGAGALARSPTIRHRRHGRSDSRTHSRCPFRLIRHSPFAAAVLVCAPPVPLARLRSGLPLRLHVRWRAPYTASGAASPKRPRLGGSRGRGGSADKLSFWTPPFPYFPPPPGQARSEPLAAG